MAQTPTPALTLSLSLLMAWKDPKCSNEENFKHNIFSDIMWDDVYEEA